jgi:hypothetical protein
MSLYIVDIAECEEYVLHLHALNQLHNKFSVLGVDSSHNSALLAPLVGPEMPLLIVATDHPDEIRLMMAQVLRLKAQGSFQQQKINTKQKSDSAIQKSVIGKIGPNDVKFRHNGFVTLLNFSCFGSTMRSKFTPITDSNLIRNNARNTCAGLDKRYQTLANHECNTNSAPPSGGV